MEKKQHPARGCHTFASYQYVRPGYSSPYPRRCPGWALSSCPHSSLPDLHTQAALYVRTFIQGKLLQQLGHGVSRVDLHGQLRPCKGTGGDSLIPMLLEKDAVSHDRRLNNKTQLGLELSFEQTSDPCLKRTKTDHKATVSRSREDGVSSSHRVSPTGCSYKPWKECTGQQSEDSKVNDRWNTGEED